MRIATGGPAPLRRAAFCLLLLTPFLPARPQARPARTFATHCTFCHGGDANGTDRAPGILSFVAAHSDAELSVLVRTGRPDRGMPKFDFNDSEMKVLAEHLRGLAAGTVSAAAGPGRGSRGGGPLQPRPAALKLSGGRTLEGTLTSSTPFSATLLTADGKFHLLARSGEMYTERAIEPKLDWPSYDGGYTGNRYSPLDRITTANVKRLAPAWIFPVPGAPRLEVTPVVVDGVMYVTAANEAYALDATTGRPIWAFRTPRTPGLLSEAGGGANRGVSVSGNRVFMITDNAHLLALDRTTGHKLWDVMMGDSREGYSATAAPLAIEPASETSPANVSVPASTSTGPARARAPSNVVSPVPRCVSDPAPLIVPPMVAAPEFDSTRLLASVTPPVSAKAPDITMVPALMVVAPA